MDDVRLLEKRFKAFSRMKSIAKRHVNDIQGQLTILERNLESVRIQKNNVVQGLSEIQEKFESLTRNNFIDPIQFEIINEYYRAQSSKLESIVQIEDESNDKYQSEKKKWIKNKHLECQIGLKIEELQLKLLNLRIKDEQLVSNDMNLLNNFFKEKKWI